MKKYYSIKAILFSIALSFLSMLSFAQVINEDFSTGLPTGWSATANTGSPWDFTNPGSRSITGANFDANFAIIDSDNQGSGSNQQTYLTTSSFSTLGDNVVTLEFSEQYRVCCGSTGDVKVSTDGGSTYTTVLSRSSTSIGYPNPAVLTTVDISSVAANQASVIIQWEYNGSWDYWWAIDNVQVQSSSVSCADPSALSESNVTSTSADLDWTENNSATSWTIEYGPAGFTQGTGTSVSVSSRPHSISGLSPSTSYDWYVSSDCGASGVSGYVMSSFTTSFNAPRSISCVGGATLTTLFSDEFDNISNWTGNVGSGNGNWNSNSGSTGSSNTGPSSAHSGTNYFYYEASSTTANSGSAVSPAIDLSGVSTAVELSFWMHAYGASIGTFEIGVSSSVSGPFTNVFTWSGQYQTSSADPWVNIGVNLDSYIGQIIYIELKNTDAIGVGSGFDGDIAIDLMEIETCVSCVPPSSPSIANRAATSVDLSWSDPSGTSWEIEYGPSGFTQGSGTTISVSTNPYSVTGLAAATAYDFYVRADCGADQSPWVGPLTVATGFNAASGVNCTSGTPSVIFSEEFDNNNAGWTGDIGSAGGNWEIPDDATSSNTGADNAYSGANYMNFEASGGTSGSIISPAIDLSAAQGEAELSFWMHAYGADMGDLNIGIGTSASGPFTPVFFHTGQIQTSGAAPWQNVGIDLNSYIGQTIYVEFDMSNYSGFTSDMSIDLFEVSTCVSCFAPTSPTVNNVTANSADLGWTAATASAWDIEYGPSGFTLGAGTTVNVTTNPYTLTALTSNTTYDWYVRENCGPGDESAWISGVPFTTLCDAFTLPFTENFENGGSIPSCWAQGSGNGSDDWDFGTGSAATYGPTSGFGGSGYYAWIDDSSPNETSTSIETPSIDLGAAANPGLEFQMWSEDHGSQSQFLLHIDVDAGSGFTNVATLDVNNTGWELQRVSLDGYQNQTIQIRFRGEEVGTGFQKDIAIDNISVDDGFLCENPTGLRAIFVDDVSGRLEWDNASNTSFKVQWAEMSQKNNPAAWSSATKGSASRHDISGLSPNTAYIFNVRSWCKAGWSPERPFEVFTTLANPCDIPTNPSTDAITDDRVRFNWDVMPNTVKYRVRYREQGTSTWTTFAISDPNRNFYFETGLQASTTYEWRVKNVCQYGQVSGTKWSSIMTFTTDPSAAPGARLKAGDQPEQATQSLLVYPNPNNGEFNLSMTLEQNVQYTLEIRDLTGRIIQNEVLTGTGQQMIKQIEINEAQGVYLLRLASDKDVTVKRIIVE